MAEIVLVFVEIPKFAPFTILNSTITIFDYEQQGIITHSRWFSGHLCID
jgi:hypothetical protein